MPLQLIHDELFFVEYEEGDRLIQRIDCDLKGHDLAVIDEVHETYIIQQGVCVKCGKGNRYFKMTKKQTEDFKREMETLR